LRSGMRNRVAAHERTRRALEDKLRYFDLRPRLRRDRERLSYTTALVATLIKAGLHKRRRRFENLHAELNQLNPRLVLARGYAIVLNDKGEILKAALEAAPDSEIKLLFAADSLRARVVALDPAE
jgi:exodeoxyribonuclease VII large subunit